MTGFGPLGGYPLGGSIMPDAPDSTIEILIDNANALLTLIGSATRIRALANSATASDTTATLLVKVLAEAANASESVTSLLAVVAKDSAVATALLSSTGSYLRQLVNNAAASDGLRAAFRAIVSDEADASEVLEVIQSHYGVLRDRVLATNSLTTSLTASNLLFGAAIAADLPGWAFSAHLNDEAGALDTLLNTVARVGALLDTAQAEATLANTLTVFGLLNDTAEATETFSGPAQLFGLLSSGASAAVVLRFGADEYTAWVLNTENIAVTQYTNYNFNSYASYDSRYFGASESGIYRLSGDDDAGEAIQAYFRAPLTDFGFASLKRAPEFAIGYTSTGDLLLKAVVVSPNGIKEEHWYRLEPRPALGTRETRKQTGKGLKSVYWQYEIHNINGADFQINTVRMWPMGLTRKVR